MVTFLLLHKQMTKQKQRSSVTIRKMREKTQLCRDYPNCSYGESCVYAHGRSELVNPGEKYSSIYRTIPCAYLKKQGVCKFGSRCFFAHDLSDQKLPSRPRSASPTHSKPTPQIDIAELLLTSSASETQKPLTSKDSYGYVDVDFYSGLVNCLQQQPNAWLASSNPRTDPAGEVWLMNPLDVLVVRQNNPLICT